jgi:hypothetical protein
MARYLKSLVTGVVLPYNTATLKSADVRQMSASECVEYEESMGLVSAPVVEEPVVEEPVVEEPVVEEPVIEEPVVEIQDHSEGEPEIEAVLGALEAE